VIGERTSLDVLHDNAFACGNVQPIGNIGGHGANAESELAFFRTRTIAAVFLFAEARGKQLGAVRNRHRDVLFLAVANYSQSNLSAGFAAGDVAYQVVTVLHRPAVHGINVVSDL